MTPGSARLAISGLEVRFGSRPVVQIDEFTLGEAEIAGLAGESGSGKSMTTLAILGLAHTVGATVSGSIRLDGTELTGQSQRELRKLRGKQIAAIFQSRLRRSARCSGWARWCSARSGCTG